MREKSIIKKNIIKYLDYKGVSKYEFYQETNVSNGVLSQKSGMSEENTLRFLSAYSDVNPEWLLTGKGPMIKEENNKSKDSFQEGIPLVSNDAIAGFGNLNFAICEEDIQQRYVIPEFKDIDFMITIRGSSMYPKYNSGDVVACRILRDPQFIQWNKTYIIGTHDQGILCKRLMPSEKQDHFLAVSDNVNYPPFDIPTSELTGIALIVGVVRLE